MSRTSRKSIVSTGIVFTLALAASTLAAQDVTTNSMPGTDFSKFHTYNFLIYNIDIQRVDLFEISE